MQRSEQGFTLIELITVIILVSIISVTLFSKIGSISSTNVQASRDDLIAALFFAQQTAMARSNIQVVVTSGAVNVTESGTPIVIHSKGYPLNFPSGVTASPITFTYDKLGRTTAGIITLVGGGASATVTVEASGYAH